MQHNERKASRTRSPRGRSPSGRMSRWPCKDYLKGTCNNSFCEGGTLQNAFSTRPRVVVGLGKSALMHIVRLMNSRLKGPKRMMTKVQCSYAEERWHERGPVTDQCHDRSGKPDKRSDKKLGRRSSQRRSSSARHLVCVFQDMKPPKSILRKSSDMQRPIQREKFTKAIARHTKTRDQNPSLGYNGPGEIGLRRRQSGKSKVTAKQRGSWPKVC